MRREVAAMTFDKSELLQPQRKKKVQNSWDRVEKEDASIKIDHGT